MSAPKEVWVIVDVHGHMTPLPGRLPMTVQLVAESEARQLNNLTGAAHRKPYVATRYVLAPSDPGEPKP